MSWTDSTTVKNHLFDLDKLPTEYTDVPLKIDSNGEASLPHRGIVENSERLKRIATLDLTEESAVQLNAEQWKDLNFNDLVKGEIIVAYDQSLETVYQLDIDFAVDWEDGELRRIDGGDISDGQAVEVFYKRYEVMVQGVDYSITPATGEIAILPGGGLEPDTTVYADYEVSAASGADQLISEAITQVEDKILALLKDDYDGDSEDQGLKTGATELALATICRGLATRALSDGESSAEARSRGWRELADQYESLAWRTLRPFLKSPVMIKGSKKSNRSWDWS